MFSMFQVAQKDGDLVKILSFGKKQLESVSQSEKF